MYDSKHSVPTVPHEKIQIHSNLQKGNKMVNRILQLISILTYLLYLAQWSLTFFTAGTSFMEDNYSTNPGRDGFRMILMGSMT